MLAVDDEYEPDDDSNTDNEYEAVEENHGHGSPQEEIDEQKGQGSDPQGPFV